MVKEMSLRDLQKAVAREKSKEKTAEERRALERELKILREGKSAKLLRRFGRGALILGKKGAEATGKGIVKARKFAEESGAGEGLNVRFSGSPSRKQRPIMRKRRVKRRKNIQRRNDDSGFFSGLDMGF